MTASYKLNKIINMLKESAGFSEESTYVKELVQMIGPMQESSIENS